MNGWELTCLNGHTWIATIRKVWKGYKLSPSICPECGGVGA